MRAPSVPILAGMTRTYAAVAFLMAVGGCATQGQDPEFEASSTLLVSSSSAEIGCGYGPCPNGASRCGDNFSFGVQLRNSELPKALAAMRSDTAPVAPPYGDIAAADISTHWVEFIADPGTEQRVDLDYDLARTAPPISGCWRGTVTALYDSSSGTVSMVLHP